ADLTVSREEGMAQDSPRQLIVVCAGGHAREVASYVRDLQAAGEQIVVRAFVDDHRFDSVFEGAPILGGLVHLRSFLSEHADAQFSYITAIRDNRARAKLIRRLDDLGALNLEPWTARHPTAIVGDAVQIGPGTCIAPGVIVTTGVTIGAHSILNVHSSVSHDASIGPLVNVSPGASICAGVTLGEGCTVGAGATVTDGIQVGEWSVICA